ncbi:protein-L-isoaspartate O-methyltransferase, partial [bacterium F11]
DGFNGWPEKGPFDGIVVTAAPKIIPAPLKDQLKIGGIMVIPVGTQDKWQTLKKIRRISETSFEEDDVMTVRFVPFTGTSQ